MTIQAGIRTPGVYTEINTQTERTGLPDNRQRVLLVTSDSTGPALPVTVYDRASADGEFGAGSVAGRMIAAALRVNPLVDAQAVAAAAASGG